MNAAAATHFRLMNDGNSQGPGNSLWISLALHAAIVIFAIVGLPHMTRPIPPVDTPVPVEIITVGEITTTNKPPVEAPKPKEPPPEEKPLQREEIKKPPAPPKVDAVKPPVTKPKPPEPPKEQPKAETPKPAVPPPDAQKLEKPLEETPPLPPIPPQPEQDNTQEDFDSLLRNLQDSAPTVDESLPVVDEVVAPPIPSPIGDFSKQLLVSEADALRQQLSQCWSIQAGARYAEDLVVEVRLTVNRDRTVQNAVIQDRWRYNQDPAFRAAADSAVRAVLSPMCTPLRLPPEKYEGWKDIIVSFDPKDML